MTSRLVIAIDGPAGAGKSTVARALADRLSLRYLDTGAMYRALALFAARQGLGPEDGEKAAAQFDGHEIGFSEGSPPRIYLDQEDVSEAIRTLEIAELASRLSTHPAVRQRLVEMQQQIIAAGGVVLEGRDATTVIAPNAPVKVYLTASLEERARRRTREFETKGSEADFREVRAQMELRDHRDITRSESPLTVAPDAAIIESGHRTVEEVVAEIVRLAESANP